MDPINRDYCGTRDQYLELLWTAQKVEDRRLTELILRRLKDMVQGQEGGAVRPGQLALVVADDAGVLGHVLQGMEAHLALGRIEDQAIGLRQRPAQDHHFRAEQVQGDGQHLANVGSRLVEDLVGQLVTGMGGLDQFLKGELILFKGAAQAGFQVRLFQALL